MPAPKPVGFRLTGQYPPSFAEDADGFLHACERFFADITEPYPIPCTHDVDLERRPTLFVDVHPAAEPLFITDCGGGRFLAWAHTSMIGPGYHIHLCELFHDLDAHLGLEVDPPGGASDHGPTGDSTSYYFTRDRAAAERAFLESLASVCRDVRDGGPLEPDDQIMLGMRSGTEYSSGPGHPIITAMGPRSLAWVADAARNPAAAARDVFPWREPGLGAAYHLGRALARLWCDVHWCRPHTNERAMEVAYETLAALGNAYRLDPTLDYPWREWRELTELTFLRAPTDADVAEFAARVAADPVLAARPLIGYRRQTVVRRWADWKVRIPGDMMEHALDPEQFLAISPASQVSVFMFVMPLDPRFGAGPASVDHFLTTRDPLPRWTVVERFEFRARRSKGIAYLCTEWNEGLNQMSYQLKCLNAVPGWSNNLTVMYFKPEQRALALNIWHTLDVADDPDF